MDICYMRYVDLQEITQEHLWGSWEVYNRRLNSNGQVNDFTDVRLVEIKLDNYRSINGKERIGSWVVERDQQIIYNPQLKFFIDGKQVAHAIITRLVTEPDLNGELHKLTLYFNTGLELVLHKRGTQSNQPQ